MGRKKRGYNYKYFQYYNFKNQFNDIIPYFQLNFSGGFISFGWLWITLSAFIFPRIKVHRWKYGSRYFTIINRKLYLIYNIGCLSSPRILVSKDCITFILGIFHLEYER